jgi:hypothetical protein
MSHEDLSRQHHGAGSSNRAFGFVFTGVFVLVALWPLRLGAAPRWWALGAAAVILALALLKPIWLALPNRGWTALGGLMSRIVAPLSLGIVYYLVLTPVGVLMRLRGQDPLRLKPDRKRTSHWVQRQPPGPAPDSMDRQF